MTDYLLRFDRAGDIDLPSGEGPCWLADGKTIMPVEVVTVEAVYSEGEEPEVLTPQEVAPGHWFVVATDAPFDHPAILPWADNPGRVTPTFAGRDFPAE